MASRVTKPRERTLDELASVLGYSNFKEFSNLVLYESIKSVVPFHLQFSFEHAIEEGKLNKAAMLYLEMVELSPSAKFFSRDLSVVLYRDLSASNQALSFLSSSEFGRESFFQTFVDEDDLTGNYSRSLNEYFVPNASLEGKQFMNLYSMRKKILSLDLNYQEDSNVLELKNLPSIHLKARAIELNLLRLKNLGNAQKEIELGKLSEQTLNLFCECANRSEELALLGRFARGILFGGNANKIHEHKGISQAMFSMLNQPIVDYEFQIPIYSLLNLLNPNREIPIPPASSWPNAYYSSAVFLLTKEQRMDYEKFFQSKLGIHKSYLYAY